jgi:transposase
MKRVDEFKEIYLHREPTDMRKSMDSLSILVQEEMGKNPFDHALFVFCNRRRNLLKILYWDKSGYALWFKKLEKEKFKWPKKDEKEVIEIRTEQLQWLLDGYLHWRMKPHEELQYEKVF